MVLSALTDRRLGKHREPRDRLNGVNAGISRPESGFFEQRAAPGQPEFASVIAAPTEQATTRVSAGTGFRRAARPMPPPAVDARESVKSLV
jgi:hypothetical protein